MKLPRAWAEIDLDAVAANLQMVRQSIRPGCQVLGVVKADAYGHGAVQVARTLERCGVTMLGVGDSHEAIELREHGIRCPILVLGAVVEGEIPDLLHHRVTPTVHSPDRIEAFARTARGLGVRMPVHLLIDTGMGLLGVKPALALTHIQSIADHPELDLQGIGTHFAAPVADPEFSRIQLERFRRVVSRAHRRWRRRWQARRFPLLHAASSAALSLYPDAHFDMVRVGGYLHGIPLSERAPRGLRPVLSLRTQVVHIRDLPPGTPVSYDGTFVTRRRTRAATLAVGYHDGYSSRLSNRAEVLVHGRRAKVIGRVTMDYTVVDVTDIPDVEVGTPVALLGREQDSRAEGVAPARIRTRHAADWISATELADWAGTIPYEIPSSLGPRVQRMVVFSPPSDHPKVERERRLFPRPIPQRYLERVELEPSAS